MWGISSWNYKIDSAEDVAKVSGLTCNFTITFFICKGSKKEGREIANVWEEGYPSHLSCQILNDPCFPLGGGSAAFSFCGRKYTDIAKLLLICKSPLIQLLMSFVFLQEVGSIIGKVRLM